MIILEVKESEGSLERAKAEISEEDVSEERFKELLKNGGGCEADASKDS